MGNRGGAVFGSSSSFTVTFGHHLWRGSTRQEGIVDAPAVLGGRVLGKVHDLILRDGDKVFGAHGLLRRVEKKNLMQDSKT